MAGLIEKLHKIGDVINTVARVALGVTSIALCIAVIGQFILRWFGATMPWATEFSCYIFVWTTMLGSAVASRHLLHIGVDMVINLCHGKTRQFMMVLADVILLFALVLFTISGWNYTVAQIPHLGTTIKVSLALFYAALPVSGLIMIYYTFVQLIENICYGEAKKIPLPGDEE